MGDFCGRVDGLTGAIRRPIASAAALFFPLGVDCAAGEASRGFSNCVNSGSGCSSGCGGGDSSIGGGGFGAAGDSGGGGGGRGDTSGPENGTGGKGSAVGERGD